MNDSDNIPSVGGKRKYMDFSSNKISPFPSANRISNFTTNKE